MIIKQIRPILYFLLFFLFSLATAEINSSRENAITRAIQKVGPAVASINVIQVKQYRNSSFIDDPLFRFLFPEEPYRQRVPSLGSGIVISPDGYIITNQHVVEDAAQILVTLPGGKEYDGELIGEDLSLIHI